MFLWLKHLLHDKKRVLHDIFSFSESSCNIITTVKKDKEDFAWIRKTIQNFQLRLSGAKYHVLIIAPAFQQGGVYLPQSRFVGFAGLQSLICLPINFRKAVFVNIRLNKRKMHRNTLIEVHFQTVLFLFVSETVCQGSKECCVVITKSGNQSDQNIGRGCAFT